jgi:hypothetical protein
MNQLKIEGVPVNCKPVKIKEILFTKENVEYFSQIIVEVQTYYKSISPSPLHGRSIIAKFDIDTGRFTMTKGNGLTYFPYGFISTEELENYAWGYLRKKDAIRDYLCGDFVSSLGVLCNKMEAVFTLEPQTILFSDKTYEIEPTILQYNVICPYRISDIPFLSKEIVLYYINNWSKLFEIKYSEIHCNAAEVLLKNIKIMHKNEVLHNAIHSQNYTLCLELLDFELSRTPLNPYENEADEKIYKKLQKREIIQSLEIVNQIAFYFKEPINNKILRQIMIKNGFEHYLTPL